MVSPYLNFYMMLGDRYGWQPLPNKINEDEFNTYRTLFYGLTGDWVHCTPHELFEKWYTLDTNAKPAAYLLNKRYDGDGFDHDSQFLSEAFRHCIHQINMELNERHKYYLSATGLEIVKGALEIENKHAVICFFRDIQSISEHVDMNEDKRRYLLALKNELENKFPQYSYSVSIGKLQNHSSYLSRFERETYNVLKKPLMIA